MEKEVGLGNSDYNVEEVGNIEKSQRDDKINQGQFYDLITGKDVSWQSIIYDLIKSEQLDPWDIDVSVLADKYVLVIQELEEESFFISSKVLLACSLLVRLKSEILTNEYIPGLDAELFGRQEDKKYELERIELDDDEIPVLVPRTPMPRFRKVTLKELMGSLHKAIETENKRIKREIKKKQAEKSALVVMPSDRKVPLKTRISIFYTKIKQYLTPKERIEMTFHDLAPSRDEKLSAFLPVLHLTNDDRLYLRQQEHFKDVYMRLERIEEELEELKKELGSADEEEKIEEIKDELEDESYEE